MKRTSDTDRYLMARIKYEIGMIYHLSQETKIPTLQTADDLEQLLGENFSKMFYHVSKQSNAGNWNNFDLTALERTSTVTTRSASPQLGVQSDPSSPGFENLEHSTDLVISEVRRRSSAMRSPGATPGTVMAQPRFVASCLLALPSICVCRSYFVHDIFSNSLARKSLMLIISLCVRILSIPTKTCA
jgi:hypothetical protein